MIMVDLLTCADTHKDHQTARYLRYDLTVNWNPTIRMMYKSRVTTYL